MLRTPRGLVLTAASGVVVPLVLYGGYRLYRQYAAPERDRPTIIGQSPETWSVDQVGEWLLCNGAAHGTIQQFARYHVDGVLLLQMSTRDLRMMGMELRECDRVVAALALLEIRPTSLPTDQADAGRSAVSAAPARSRVFVGEALDMLAAIASPTEASSMTAERHRAQLVSRVFHVLGLFHDLSESDRQAAMLPLARHVHTVLLQPDTAGPPDAPRPLSTHAGASARPIAVALPTAPAAAAAVPAEAADGVHILGQVLDNFLSVLGSERLLSISPSEGAELAARIGAQMERMQQVIAILPLNVGAPLTEKCHEVRRRLTCLTGNAPLDQADPHDRRTVKELVGRLSVLFERAKDPATLAIPPQERLSLVMAMMDEAMSIQAASAELPGANDAQVIFDATASVTGVFEQLLSLTREEIAVGAEATGPSAEDALPSVSEALQGALQVLQSPDFRKASPSVQKAIARDLLTYISEMETELLKLPLSDQEAMTAVFTNTKDLLQSLLAGGEAEPAETHVPPVQPPQDQDPLGLSLLEMEAVFNEVNSPEFEQSTTEEQCRRARELLERVQKAKAVALEYTEATNPLISELMVPLEHMLTRFAAPTTESSQFRELGDMLHSIYDALSSPSFASSSATKQKEVARTLLPRLQAITAAFARLRPTEQAALQKVMQPIHETLSQVMQRGEEAGTEAVDEEASGEGSASQVDALRHAIAEMQVVMKLVQSPEFLRASPEERTEMVRGALVTLQRLKQTAAQLGGPAEALMAVVDRLISHLVLLVPEEEAASRRSDPPGRNLDAFMEVFQSLHPILTGNAPVSSSQLKSSAELVQSTLNAAAESQLDWISNAKARQLVFEVQRALSKSLPPSTTETWEKEDDERHLAETLLEMSDRLRDGVLPSSILDQYDFLVDSLSSVVHSPRHREAIASIKEQIHLQRISNGDFSIDEEAREESTEGTSDGEDHDDNDNGDDDDNDDGDDDVDDDDGDDEDDGTPCSNNESPESNGAVDQQRKNAFKEDDDDESSLGDAGAAKEGSFARLISAEKTCPNVPNPKPAHAKVIVVRSVPSAEGATLLAESKGQAIPSAVPEASA